jgi:hypothetical protein
MAARGQLECRVHHQPLGAAQAKVRVDKGDCQRPLKNHGPLQRKVESASTLTKTSGKRFLQTWQGGLFASTSTWGLSSLEGLI